LRELRGLNVSLNVLGETMEKRMGMSRRDILCLSILAQRGEMTAGQVATALNITSGAATGVINRLVRAGYAQRLADPADRRKALVRLADGAVQPLDRTRAVAIHALEVVVRDKSDTQLHELAEVIHGIAAVLPASLDAVEGLIGPRSKR
jgi:DNA-binding MarR family transcriptional regulator